MSNNEKIMNIEYEMFLTGYTAKQIALLVDKSAWRVKRDLNAMMKKIDKEKTLVNKVLKVSFN